MLWLLHPGGTDYVGPEAHAATSLQQHLRLAMYFAEHCRSTVTTCAERRTLKHLLMLMVALECLHEQKGSCLLAVLGVQECTVCWACLVVDTTIPPQTGDVHPWDRPAWHTCIIATANLGHTLSVWQTCCSSSLARRAPRGWLLLIADICPHANRVAVQQLRVTCTGICHKCSG